MQGRLSRHWGLSSLGINFSCVDLVSGTYCCLDNFPTFRTQIRKALSERLEFIKDFCRNCFDGRFTDDIESHTVLVPRSTELSYISVIWWVIPSQCQLLSWSKDPSTRWSPKMVSTKSILSYPSWPVGPESEPAQYWSWWSRCILAELNKCLLPLP